MTHKPDLEPTFTEQAFRLGGWLTIVLGILVVAAAVMVARSADVSETGVGAWLIGYGVIVGILIFFSAPVPFAIAEALGRLRRQEERELVREWEFDRAASERVALEARERRRQQQAATPSPAPIVEE